MASKNQKVAEFVSRVESQGYRLALDGNWVKIDPCPPTDIIMEMSKLSFDLADYLQERS